jgi:hypothetical protein
MENDSTVSSSAVTQLIGVYDADGSLRGELSYWIGARIGRRHCSLCEITHGIVRERKDWIECRDGIDVPFVTLHRDEVAPDVLKVSSDGLPSVVAITHDGAILLLGPADIGKCSGSPVALINAVSESADRLHLIL